MSIKSRLVQLAASARGVLLILIIMAFAPGADNAHAVGTQTIGIVIFDGFLTSEVTAPIEVLEGLE